MAYKKLGKLYFDLTPDGLSFQWGDDGQEKLINLGPLNRLAGDEIDRDHSDEDDYVYEDVYDSDSRYSSRSDDGYDYDDRGRYDDGYEDDGYGSNYADDGYDDGYEDDRYDEYDDGYDDRYDHPDDEDPYYQPGMDDDEDNYAPGLMDTLYDLLDRFPWIVYVLLVLFPPLGIYLLWRQRMFDFTVRTVVSVVSGIWMLLILIWIFSGLGGSPNDPTANPSTNINLESAAPETFAPVATADPQDEPESEDEGDDYESIELPGETIAPTPTALVSAGQSGTGDDTAETGFVYSATRGAYYHKLSTCTAIGTTAVTQVSVDVATSRGQTQCPSCYGASVYYATAKGSYYHSNETCSNMSGASPVTKAAATKAGKTACPECVREFYISSSNAYYHSKSNCSGLTNPSQTTINAAKSAGKTACKTCIGSSSASASSTKKATAAPTDYSKATNKYDAGVIVYAKKGGSNYHRSATCTSSGMSGGQKITLYNAINFGYTACKYCLPDGNDTVYCDQSGSKYHKTDSCSAAKNVVKTSLGKALAVGADKCSKCWSSTTSSGSTSSGTTTASGPKVYVTSSSKYYHTRKACGGMTNPTKIYLSQALEKGIPACNDCAGQANNTVYAASGDKCYHYSSKCSNLKGTPTKGTLAMALADELSACSKCVNTSSNSDNEIEDGIVDKSGLSVYITQKGDNYHANTSCSELGSEEYYKVSLGVAVESADKTPCSKCCASASHKVYSSASDKYYHFNKNCSLLPGTAKSATLARALMDGLKACPACTDNDDSQGVSATPAPEIVPVSSSVSGKTVYVVKSGKTYHISKTCSKISKYEINGISLETAKNYKLTACSTCSSIASRTVYGNGSSKYYHASKKCEGVSYTTSGTLENALLVGLEPCPVCISGTSSGSTSSGSSSSATAKPTATPKPSSGGAADGTTTVYIDLANNYEVYHKSKNCSYVDEPVGVTLSYVLDIGFEGCGKCNPPTKLK